DLNHPDLRNQLVGGKSFVAGTSSPLDDNGHGTHVAGIIGAEIGNNIGVAGIAPACKLMPIKALDAAGEGNTSDIVAGLLYAADAGARIINLSLGGGAGGTALANAIEYVQGKGCLVIAAMGNDGRNAQEYPAAYPGVIGVGAINSEGSLADFSNYGRWISVTAPGEGIWSTLPGHESAPATLAAETSGYGYLSGTSMATPYVAGVAALLSSLYPNLPPAAVKLRLERTADQIGFLGFSTYFGNGRINARRAIQGS
ncbi:MAG: S8 family serine peptidase, partial [Cyanobacteria bacterium NC_groundwater_1444_Ag_S-0.65um_54_12]|nr:S8 family serine peptidase [Cyanobacteria bacterium NC_groundwater_1444_Ag_S-0.65um_54_12]